MKEGGATSGTVVVAVGDGNTSQAGVIQCPLTSGGTAENIPDILRTKFCNMAVCHQSKKKQPIVPIASFPGSTQPFKIDFAFHNTNVGLCLGTRL